MGIKNFIFNLKILKLLIIKLPLIMTPMGNFLILDGYLFDVVEGTAYASVSSN